MSLTKNFYHEEINQIDEIELQKANDLDEQYWQIRAEEDAQIIARAEEMEHSEMPNFLR